MRALSVRQPYAELILRGTKTIEYRSRPTHILGERFYLYAAKGKVAVPASLRGKVWSRDLANVTGAHAPPPWLLELAEGLILGELPTGVIVGTACIERCRDVGGRYEWDLADVRRATTLRKPTRHPQPSWFRPFEADDPSEPAIVR